LHLDKVYGYTVPDNYRMINLSIKKGFKTEKLDDYTVKMLLAMPR
jgi:hypothetical protein